MPVVVAVQMEINVKVVFAKLKFQSKNFAFLLNKILHSKVEVDHLLLIVVAVAMSQEMVVMLEEEEVNEKD